MSKLSDILDNMPEGFNTIEKDDFLWSNLSHRRMGWVLGTVVKTPSTKPLRFYRIYNPYSQEEDWMAENEVRMFEKSEAWWDKVRESED